MLFILIFKYQFWTIIYSMNDCNFDFILKLLHNPALGLRETLPQWYNLVSWLYNTLVPNIFPTAS